MKNLRTLPTHRLLLGLTLVLASLAAAATPALAARGHVFGKSFGEAGPGAGQFSEPEGVAVSEATGDVYVADRGNNRVQFFEPELDAKQQVIKYRVAGQFTGSSAVGKGTLEAGSVTVTAVATESGEFTVGAEVSGIHVPAGARIVAVGEGTLELSAGAEASGEVALTDHQAFQNMKSIAIDNSCRLLKLE